MHQISLISSKHHPVKSSFFIEWYFSRQSLQYTTYSSESTSRQIFFTFFCYKFMFLSQSLSTRFFLIPANFIPLHNILFMRNELCWLLPLLLCKRNFAKGDNVMQVLWRSRWYTVRLSSLFWGWRSRPGSVPFTSHS